MPREDLDELERFACPGAGTCAGHFTANTMAVAIDCLGIACIGDALVPADEVELKGEAAARAGALAVHLVEQGLTARSFLDRRALLTRWPVSPRPAARRTASFTCSPLPTKREWP